MPKARTPAPLQQELAGADRTRSPTALDAFRRARRRFLDGRRVDMSALAIELGVNRVTLYRWVGCASRPTPGASSGPRTCARAPASWCA